MEEDGGGGGAVGVLLMRLRPKSWLKRNFGEGGGGGRMERMEVR